MIIAMRKRLEGEKGFTLIELLVVVIIIGILAAIAIPVFLRQRERAYNSSAQSDLRNLAVAQESFYTENDTYTTDPADLEGRAQEGFVQSLNVEMDIVAADDQWFCAEASHTASDDTWVYDSSRGGLQRGPGRAEVCPGGPA